MCVCALSDGLSKDYLDVPSPWADYQVLAFERWLFQLVDGLWQEWVRSHPWSHLLNRWQGVQRQRGRAHHDQTSCTGLSVCVCLGSTKRTFLFRSASEVALDLQLESRAFGQVGLFAHRARPGQRNQSSLWMCARRSWTRAPLTISSRTACYSVHLCCAEFCAINKLIFFVPSPTKKNTMQVCYTTKEKFC